MKKAILILSLLFILILSYVSIYAQTDVKYQGKVCKMEIFTTDSINSRNKLNMLKNEVEKFCTDKYIYDIKVFSEKGEYIFIVFYN